MSREEWKLHWQRVRAERPKSYVCIGQITPALQELYDYVYLPKQDVYIHLVNRYKAKLRQEHFDKIESWKPEAKKRAKERLGQFVYYKNPLFELFSKGGFKGSYMPVPMAITEEEKK